MRLDNALSNRQAASWDGQSDFWWAEKFTNQGLVNEMLSQSLRQLTGQSNDKASWEALFTHFKIQHGQSGGYRPGEKIAIKVNLNGSKNHGNPLNNSFTSPALVLALLNQLVHTGVKPNDITLYDASRFVPDPIVNVCGASSLAGMHFADFSGGDGREACQRDLSHPIQWSVDPKGNPAYLPTVVTQAAYLINMSLFKGHSLAGVTLTAKNHFGTLMSDLNGQPTINPPQGANLHGFVAANGAQGATIKTDGWAAYPGAPGFDHDPQVVGFMAAHVVLPWIHRVFSNLKTWALGVYHGLRDKHLQSYLDEFVFRFNRRRSRHAGFSSLFSIALAAKPVTYKMLIEPDGTE